MSIQLEISLSAYSKIERDESPVSVQRLQQIAEILNVSVTGILHFDEHVLIDQANSGEKVSTSPPHTDPLVEQVRSEVQFLRSLINRNASLEE